ncbi:hypothetical protein HanXRQr2_Chr11g0488361 [Helianthus annuus]|uniref:Uncharacterized protein n=1 Tax=Helianthus annuus TaxID=4232 RepID=A0A9K3HNK2_HELAN|nr:hypothetical protein HanXRQr2_Chr11g0488361 [Helianthus annuus]
MIIKSSPENSKSERRRRICCRKICVGRSYRRSEKRHRLCRFPPLSSLNHVTPPPGVSGVGVAPTAQSSRRPPPLPNHHQQHNSDTNQHKCSEIKDE